MGPDFIVIGGERCGTTWLWQQLRNHPGTFFPALKELEFFTAELWPKRRRPFLDNLLKHYEVDRERWDRDHVSRLVGFVQCQLACDFGTSADYLALFEPKGEKLAGDISPGYSCLEKPQVAKMKQLCPNAKIILTVRDPVERFLSSVRLKASERGIEVTDEFTRTVLGWDAQVRQSSYSKTVEIYREYFADEELLIMPFDWIGKEPHKFLERFCGHVGLAFDPIFFPNVEKKIFAKEGLDVSHELRNELNEIFGSELEIAKQWIN